MARAPLLPHLEVRGKGSRTDVLIDHSNPVAYPENGYTVALTQSLFNAADWEEWRISKTSALAASISLLDTEQAFVVRFLESYLSALAAQEDLLFARKHLDAIETQLTAAHRRLELGAATIVDVDEGLASKDAATTDFLSAQNEAQARLADLSMLVGKPLERLPNPAEAFAVPGPVPERIDAWVAQARTDSYSVRLREIVVQRGELNLKAARAAYLPTIDLTLRRDQGDYSYINSVTSYNAARRQGKAFYAGIQITIPIFDGLSTQGAIGQRSAERDASLGELEQSRRDAELATRLAYLNLQSALAQIDARSAASRSGQTVVVATQRGYALGIRTNLDVLDAEDRYFRSKRDEFRSRIQGLKDSLELKASAGILDASDVEHIEQLIAASRRSGP